MHPSITYRHFTVLESTNAYLMQTPVLCPYLVSADTQTAGRGRRQQTWVDEGNSLLFSLATAFLPQINVGAWSIQVAITLAETLETVTNNQILIKWPNDLYIKTNDGKDGKFAGILVESSMGKSGKMITGVGINLSPITTAVSSDYAVAHLSTDRDYPTLLTTLANALYRQWQVFLQHPQVCPDRYARYDMLKHHTLLATDLFNQSETTGQGCGINEQGQLLIQQHGDLRCLTSQQRIRIL